MIEFLDPVQTPNISWAEPTTSNRPFPSSKKSHFQSEAKCEAIDMKMIFNYDAKKTHFHNKGFAFSLVLKVRFFGTRKWPTRIALFNLEFCRAGIKIGVWHNSVDLIDLGRRSFELGSAHEKFGVYIRSKYTFSYLKCCVWRSCSWRRRIIAIWRVLSYAQVNVECPSNRYHSSFSAARKIIYNISGKKKFILMLCMRIHRIILR